MAKKNLRIILNIFLAVMPFAAWAYMMGGPAGLLASRGLTSLRYFTVLSNLFEGAASAIWIGCSLINGRKETGRENGNAPHWAEVLKYVACLSVFLTFATVMVFLGPLYGYGMMFAGGNLWLHLIVPLAALFEMVFLVREDFSGREAALCILPVLIYGSWYFGNVLANGRGDEVNGWNDFYGFLMWGIPAGIAIFVFICLFLLGAAMVIKRITRNNP